MVFNIKRCSHQKSTMVVKIFSWQFHKDATNLYAASSRYHYRIPGHIGLGLVLGLGLGIVLGFRSELMLGF